MLWFMVLGTMLSLFIAAIGAFMILSLPLHILGLKKY